MVGQVEMQEVASIAVAISMQAVGCCKSFGLALVLSESVALYETSDDKMTSKYVSTDLTENRAG